MSDMYAFVTLEGRPKPLAVPVLAWSHGCSSGGGRYGMQVNKKPVDENDRKAQEWTAAQVQEWLTKKGVSAESCAVFKKHDVDGRALLMLTTDDVKELVPHNIGERRRLDSFLRDLTMLVDEARSVEQDVVNIQDVSMTIYLGAISQLCFLAPMLARKTLSRVSLVTFTAGARRNNRWGNDDQNDDVVIPPGTPCSMIDMRDVTVTSWSTGGSGGEDRLTGNASLSSRKITSTVFGIRDYKNLSWEMQARLLNVDPRDPTWDPEFSTKKHLERTMGVSVLFDGEKGTVVEWGGHVRWSKSTHSVYPVAFKQAVKQLLLIAKRRDECDLFKVPKDVLLLIISRLAASYNASPFADYEHPDPDSLKEKDKPEGEQDDENQ